MIVVATTLTTFAMGDPQVWGSWLENHEAISKSHNPGVKFFCAIETDARGVEFFQPLTQRLKELNAEWWTYQLDDGRTSITTANRQRHLTLGENLTADYATAEGATHLLFVAADCAPPPDVLPKLLELDHQLVGAEIPTYCLSGPEVEGYSFPVQQHLASAACVLISRALFKCLKWRYDPDSGTTDDPSYCHDALDLFGIQSYVRKDCVAKHYPESIPAIENRGYDLSVQR